MAFGLHQLASNFGVVPDAKFQAQVTGAVQGAQQAVAGIQFSSSLLGSNAAEFTAGANIAKRGDALPDDASWSAKAGFDSVPFIERGRYDANGNLK